MSRQRKSAFSAGTSRMAVERFLRFAAMLKFFHYSQLCAAAARITRTLLGARLNGLSLHPFQLRRARLPQLRNIHRAFVRVRPRVFPPEFLDHPIFRRVERDYRQAPTLLQN